MRVAAAEHKDLLLAYLRPQSARVVILSALLFGSIGLQLVNPQIIRAYIDATTGDVPLEHLTWAALLFIALALLQQALSVAATYFSEVVGWAATNALRADLASHCLHLDLTFHKGRTPGELIERIDGDVTTLATFFSQLVVRILGNLVLLVGVIGFLFVEDWRVGLAFGAFTVGSLLALVRLQGIAVPYWAAFRQASAELFGFLEERLAGTLDIRSSGAGPYVVRSLHRFTRERIDTARKARLVSSIQWGLMMVVSAVGLAIAFVGAADLYVRGAITLGTAYLIYSYTWLVFRPLFQLSNQMSELQRATAGVGRIGDLFRTEARLAEGTGRALSTGPLTVEFDRVSFGYGDGEMALRDLSFRLAPGEHLGLLGRTGSGKTTVARLLFRLYDPDSGGVRLNGVDLREMRIADLRQRVGMVTQDVQVFRATVRDNVTFFDRGLPDEQIWRALASLGLADWARSLPQGLDTVLSSGGNSLSAGEAQLLAFTRVFLKDPGLVILDEASSRLDPATERLVERAVDKLLAGRTGIVIAHRLSTVERADAILILDSGQMAEIGERIRLAADPDSRLSQLLRTGLEEVLV